LYGWKTSHNEVQLSNDYDPEISDQK
jgi:hypothetical protein